MTNYLLSHPSFIHPRSYSFIRPFTYHPFIHRWFIHASSIHSSEHFNYTHPFLLPPIHPLFIHPRTYSFIWPILLFLSFFFLAFIHLNFFTLSTFAIHPSCIPELIIHSKTKFIRSSIHSSIHPMPSIDIGHPQLWLWLVPCSKG